MQWVDTEPPKNDKEEATELTEGLPSSNTPLNIAVESISQQPQIHAEPQADIENQNAEATQTEVKKDSSSSSEAFCCQDNASPQVRANRFAVAALLFSLTLWLFLSFIGGETNRFVDEDCLPFVQKPQVHQTALIISSISFVCASFAFLRTLVDCILVRWGKSLIYDTVKYDGCFWWPLMPIAVVIGMAFGLILGLFECLKIPIALLTGDWDVSWWTSKTKGKGKATEEEGLEMQDEERRGLVSNVDGFEDDDHHEEGLPGYEEACTEGVTTHGNDRKM